MIKTLFSAYLFLLIVCFITGIICTWRLKNTFLPIKQLAWFILLTFITEMIGLQWALKFGTNHCVYNIYQVCQFCFFSFTLYRMIENNRLKKYIICISAVYTALAITNLCFIQGIHLLNTFNYYTAAVIIAFLSGYSLNELFKKANIDNPLKTPSFWVSSSILVSNSCMIPLLLPAAFSLQFTSGETRILIILITSVNFVSYSMFIVAFLYHYRNNVRSLL